ncbi:MAG TPA: hypothetical protein VF105_05355 [Gemmatimonadaceae bacterium]
MTKPSPTGSGRSTSYLYLLGIITLFLAKPLVLRGQEHHDEDHDHDHLHFSHPLVTESPSPDTKVRLDYIFGWINTDPEVRETVLRVEGEYAFTHSVSLAIVAPFTFRTAPTTDRANGLGNVEVSLKLASLRYGEHGILVGGGLSAGLPTGSDAKGIGSSHVVELEPFIDVGYKKDRLELVGFARVVSTVNRRAGEEAERNLGADFSALYSLSTRLETLLEFTAEKPLIGDDRRFSDTFIVPGVKLYPFKNRQVMFGTSVELGLGSASDARAVLVSAFYHF